MDVSITVVTYNTRDLLRTCLRSIYQENRSLSFEIIVIDNASQDGTAEMVRTEFPLVKLIHNTEDRGYGAGNNQGIRISEGRYILVLNPDTVILDRAIERCVEYADAHKDVGIVGCQVYQNEHEIQKTGFAFHSAWHLFLTLSGLSRAFPRSRVFGAGELGWWARDDERDLDVISGMFMLVRREALDEVGLFDEAYFLYAEEADLCFRFARAGWRRVFTPSARIIHVGGGSQSGDTHDVNTRMYIQLQKSILIFLKKNRGMGSWLAAKAIYIVSDAVRAAGWRAMSLGRGDSRLREKAGAASAALRYHLFGTGPTT